MKYYLEYKDREEFDKLNEYYKDCYGYVSPSKFEIPPGFIIENNTLEWKNSEKHPPADAIKISFAKWKELVNPKLEWKKGAYVRYLGTKEGKNQGVYWENWFKNKGLNAGDVGIICTNGDMFEIKDNIRDSTTGAFTKKDVQLITKEEYEAGLRYPNETYEFNEGDLVVITMFHGKTDWDDKYISYKQGEILKLGGEYWGNKNCTIKDVNTFTSLPFISKIRPDGDAYINITGLKFRHITPEEFAYYNTIGLGANINDMKKPFNIDTYVAKGELIGIPNDIIKVMLQRQVEQGNPEDVTIFEENNEANYPQNGFFWENTIEGNHIWDNVIVEKNFESFYELHKSKSDSDWKIAVHTDHKHNSRPYVIEYLLSLNKDATNNYHFKASSVNSYYYLDSKLNIGAYLKVPDDYKVIEEKDLPNYPKKSFERSYDSSLDLKWVVKSSIDVLKLLDNLKGFKHDYEKYGLSYKYINYPFYNGSHLCDTIPCDYVGISEQEALYRLNAIINNTPLILTASPLVINETDVQNEPMLIVPSTKKQSLAEQLCKIIEKEPDDIPVTSIFPTKRKSIINKLKF